MTTPVPPVLPAAYATAIDLQDYWRTLTDAEQARATFLLQRAALRINELPGSAEFNPLTCNDVSLDMVKRAMIGGGGVNSVDQAMADITAQVQYANPMGNLYITRPEKDRLYGYESTASSIAPANHPRVPLEPWNWQPTRHHHHEGCVHGTD